jgi:hypothetical protein
LVGISTAIRHSLSVWLKFESEFNMSNPSNPPQAAASTDSTLRPSPPQPQQAVVEHGAQSADDNSANATPRTPIALRPWPVFDANGAIIPVNPPSPPWQALPPALPVAVAAEFQAGIALDAPLRVPVAPLPVEVLPPSFMAGARARAQAALYDSDADISSDN